jgi:hypothetical protein
MKSLIESHYFPSIEYLSFVKSQSEIIIEAKEHFVKQTYRNRCYILSANKVLPLAIPIKKPSRKVPIDEVELEYTHKWVSDHWHSIISAYNKSPFFEYYEPYLHKILFTRHKYLLDLNMDILTFCLKVLNIDTSVSLSTEYSEKPKASFSDMRGVIHPKNDYICRKLYKPIPYKQIFGNIFVPNLSILDLISCVGPESDTYL